MRGLRQWLRVPDMARTPIILSEAAGLTQPSDISDINIFISSGSGLARHNSGVNPVS
jgi:hypothetical protein